MLKHVRLKKPSTAKKSISDEQMRSTLTEAFKDFQRAKANGYAGNFNLRFLRRHTFDENGNSKILSDGGDYKSLTSLIYKRFLCKVQSEILKNGRMRYVIDALMPSSELRNEMMRHAIDSEKAAPRAPNRRPVYTPDYMRKCLEDCFEIYLRAKELGHNGAFNFWFLSAYNIDGNGAAIRCAQGKGSLRKFEQALKDHALSGVVRNYKNGESFQAAIKSVMPEGELREKMLSAAIDHRAKSHAQYDSQKITELLAAAFDSYRKAVDMGYSFTFSSHFMIHIKVSYSNFFKCPNKGNYVALWGAVARYAKTQAPSCKKSEALRFAIRSLISDPILREAMLDSTRKNGDLLQDLKEKEKHVAFNAQKSRIPVHFELRNKRLEKRRSF